MCAAALTTIVVESGRKLLRTFDLQEWFNKLTLGYMAVA
jgi:hypothetical protein